MFRLAEDADLKKGAEFALLSPQGLNWNIHDNVINNCTQLVDFDVFGGPTAVFADNLLSRGTARNVNVAAEIRGRFRIAGNRFCGFDEPDCTALLLHPDPVGRPPLPISPDNTFDQCAKPVQDESP